jgi:hypothetical protein
MIATKPMAIRATNPNITLRSTRMMWRPWLPVSNGVPLFTSIPFFTIRNCVGPRSNTAGRNIRETASAWPLRARDPRTMDALAAGRALGNSRDSSFPIRLDRLLRHPSQFWQGKLVGTSPASFVADVLSPPWRSSKSIFTDARQKSRHADSYALRLKSVIPTFCGVICRLSFSLR